MLALCLQTDPARLLQLSGTDSAITFSIKSSEIIGLSREESIFINNFRQLSDEGKRFIENSLRYVLAGEKKSFSLPEDKQSASKPKVEEYKEEASVVNRQVSEITNAKLSSPLVEAPLSPEENQKKTDQRLETAKKEFLEGNRETAKQMFDEIVTEKASEQTRRRIAYFYFKNNALAEAKEILEKTPLKTLRSKILKGKVIAKLTSPDEAADYFKHQSSTDSENADTYGVNIAEVYFESGQIEKAREALKIVNARKVKSPIENIGAAALAVTIGEWAIAEQFARQASEIEESEEPALRLLCWTFLAQDKQSDLAVAATTYKEKFPTQPTGHLFDAIALHMQSKIEDSIVSFERAVALNLDYTTLVDSLAEYLLDEGVSAARLSPLLETFKDAGSDRYFAVFAKVLKGGGSDERSHQILMEGRKRFPNSQRLAYEVASSLYIRNDDVTKAEEVLEPFGDSKKATPSTLLLLARIKQHLNKLSSAEMFAERASKQSPNWLAPFLTLAEIYSSSGQDAKALALLDEQKGKFKDRRRTHQILSAEARIYLDGKLYEQAIPILERVCSEDHKNTHERVQLGYAYVRSNNLDKAISLFRDMRKSDSYYFTPSNNLAYALNQKGEYSSALSILEEFKSKPDLSEFDQCILHSNMAHSLVKLGRVEDALAAAKKSISLDPEWAEAHFNLALCLIAMSDFPSAKDELEKAVALDREGILLPVVQRLIAKHSH